MPVILGLHFGHDGAVAVVVDGQLASYVLRERRTRRKHDYGLDRDCLDTALREAGVCPAHINFCAVTSTQGCDAPLFKMGKFELAYSDGAALPLPSIVLQEVHASGKAIEEVSAPSMIKRVLGVPRDPRTHPVFHELFQQFEKIPFTDLKLFPMVEQHWIHKEWKHDATLRDLRAFAAAKLLSEPSARLGFHVPLTVTIDATHIPGTKVDHHLAHAASSFFRSGFETALVFTNDGYAGDRSLFGPGGVYMGDRHALVPLWPHRMTMGHVYHEVGMYLRLGALGAPGKLMGLAPYGRPIYFDPRRIGSPAEQHSLGLDPSAQGWIEDVKLRATMLNVGVDDPALTWIPFNQFQLDLAASTQQLFQRQWSELVQSGLAMAASNQLRFDGVCLSGGAALNCPSNTRLLGLRGINDLFIEPNCDDGGLAVGAALWLEHAIAKRRDSMPQRMLAREAYAGPLPGLSALENALRHRGYRMEKLNRPENMAAADLASGCIVGWFEGASEQGPRALGHRSLFAAPFNRSVVSRLNQLKGREPWRPFAPIVLEPFRSSYFDAPPGSSPFMLHAVPVRSHDIPAAAHVDGSARLQTMSADNGECYRVLHAFFELTDCPVLLNTSMNGPGEPLVETLDDLLAFIDSYRPDVTYIDGWRITLD